MNKRVLVPLERITGNPWQTRQELDLEYIEQLAEDIRRNGLLQAPVGRIVDGSKGSLAVDLYESQVLHDETETYKIQLAFGHNRLAAYRKLAEKDLLVYAMMPVDLQVIGDEQMALMAWSENEARKDLTPIEEATAIQRDMEAFGWTQKQAAEKLGLARETVANKLRLLKLPEEVKKALGEGTISERQASALLPLVELPEEAVKRAEKKEYNWTKPSKVLSDALSGKSSDLIRKQVNDAIIEATIDLEGCLFLEQVLEGKFESPACSNCTWRMKNGKQDRCQKPGCYERKELAWEELQGTEAKQITGLEVASKKLSYSQATYFSGASEVAAVKGFLENKCPNLRVQVGDYGWAPEGVKGYRVICMHNGAGCSCLEKVQKEARKEENKKKREGEKAVEELVSQAAGAIAIALTEGSTIAWKAFYKSLNNYQPKDKPGMAAVELAGLMTSSMVSNWISYSLRENADDARAKIADGMAKIGMKAPWIETETPAEEAWRKFQRVAGWLEKLTKELPKKEAMQGNIANLYELVGVDGQPDDQRETISHAIGKLERILPEVEMLDEKSFKAVHSLADGDLDYSFKSAVEEASEWAIRYAIALVDGRQQNETRTKRLKSRLGALQKKNRTLAEVFNEQRESA